MATTQDTTALAFDRQGDPDDRPRLDRTHNRLTCQVHADCVRAQKRRADRRRYPREPLERIDGLKKQMDAIALLVGNGDPESLPLLLDALAHFEGKVGEAVRVQVQSGEVSWQRVADALGVRKQSAWERFGKPKGA